MNFYKVVFGVGFSLLWARIMYIIWRQPSYTIFVGFYLGLGSILLKWVFFEIIDRLHMRLRLKTVAKELEESDMRIHEVRKDKYQAQERQVAANKVSGISLERGLKEVEDGVSSLANMVETAVKRSLEGLKRQDMELARQIIEDDRKVDEKEFAIREDCMRVIATSSPKADDLRRIVAVLGIVTELERMGDYAEGIANITLMIGEERSLELPMEVPLMASRGLEMLRGSMESFLERDVEKAKGVCQLDDEVDALYDRTFRELLVSMVQEPKGITQATRLVWVAHNLERFADRVTNICEWVVFDVTGLMVDIGASKY